MDTTFFTLFQTPRDLYTFSLSFEGDVPTHLYDAEMVSMLCLLNGLSTKNILNSL